MLYRTLCILFVFLSISFAKDRIQIAVIDLDAEGITASENKIISARLRTELSKTDKYTVIERNKVEDILKEQGFQLSGCTSNECAVEVGKLVGVKYMVAGSIGKIGGIYTINIRLINVETGEVMKTATEDCNCKIEYVLTHSMENVAKQLAGNRKNEIKKTKPQYNPTPVKKNISTPVYKAPEKKDKKKSWYFGIGYGNGKYTIEPTTEFKDEASVQFKSTIELSLGFRIINDLWLGYVLKNHTFDQQSGASKYKGEFLLHYPEVRYYVIKWLYLSYGFAFTEISYDRTTPTIYNSLTKHFSTTGNLNMFSTGATIDLGSLVSINLGLSIAKGYFAAEYDIYFNL